MRVTFARRRIVGGLLGAVLVLTLLSLAGQVARFHFGMPTLLGFVPLTYVDLENNLPTWYQTLALAFAAVLLFGIGLAERRAGGPVAGYWLALGFVFVFLSLDEAASLHEASIVPLQRLIGRLPGAWQPVWVIAGLAGAAITAAAFWRLFRHLPRGEQIQTAMAALLFLGGAIGIEMLTAAQFDTTQLGYKASFTYALLAHAEEVLEMLGVVVFIDLLLRRLARGGSFAIGFRP